MTDDQGFCSSIQDLEKEVDLLVQENSKEKLLSSIDFSAYCAYEMLRKFNYNIAFATSSIPAFMVFILLMTLEVNGFLAFSIFWLVIIVLFGFVYWCGRFVIRNTTAHWPRQWKQLIPDD